MTSSSTSSDQQQVVQFPSDTTVLLFSNVPIEPTSSAAGVRTSYLLERLAEAPGVSSVHFASRAVLGRRNAKGFVVPNKKNNAGGADKNDWTATARWKHPNVHHHEISPNRTDQALHLLFNKIPDTRNLLVIFDRFYAEEMWSFHVHQHKPDAVLVLDMQDFHAWRGHRQKWIKKQDTTTTDTAAGLSNLPLARAPTVEDPALLRELASIHRSDLTLVCSPVELELLTDKYQIPESKLCLAPLFGDLASTKESSQPASLSFQKRWDFCFVGGFLHEPNVDAVRQLKRLWPAIRDQVAREGGPASVQVHVYGSYCSDQLQNDLHDPANGFLMHGYSPLPMDEILADKRVLLSPIRFGAGIKGKHVDAWKNGLPIVTTPMGSEGMTNNDNDPKEEDDSWGGLVAETDREFIGAAAYLYNNESAWNKCVSNVPKLLAKMCGPDVWDSVATSLVEALTNRQKRRRRDFYRSVLWQQSVRSTEYFSKYIECKEKHESPADTNS